ncbi:MAG: sugar kinase [Bifidobacteriaceae bacterium]|jgi:2-dehydro-3-deoxygluconokinase|nr:sugar kinase [Bifidobacteriaceae bacterium]
MIQMTSSTTGSDGQGGVAGPDDFDVSGLRRGKVLLVGESMGLFAAGKEGPCSQVGAFSASVAGAELNVAIGLKRLGHTPMYVTRVGDDPLGERVRLFMEENHLETRLVSVDPSRHTGFMLKSKVTTGDPQTYYFRKGSAASAINAQNIFDIDLAEVSVLHLTGILPPLSSATMEATDSLVARAEFNKIFISFDPNLRPALWPSERRMHAVLKKLSGQADLVMPGIAEGEALFGYTNPEDIGKAFIGNGARYVVVKDGPRGAWATNGSRGLYVPGFVVNSIVDTVGAGDGFAAGLLSALLDGQHMSAALTQACAVGAMQTQSPSDNQGLPTPEELTDFENTHARARRREPAFA